MRQQFNKYTMILIAGVAIFLLLGGIVLAGWSRGQNFYANIERVCIDGGYLGMVHLSGDIPDIGLPGLEPSDYHLEVKRNSSIIGDYILDTPVSSVDDSPGPGDHDGYFNLDWNLNSGDSIDLRFYSDPDDDDDGSEPFVRNINAIDIGYCSVDTVPQPTYVCSSGTTLNLNTNSPIIGDANVYLYITDETSSANQITGILTSPDNTSVTLFEEMSGAFDSIGSGGCPQDPNFVLDDEAIKSSTDSNIDPGDIYEFSSYKPKESLSNLDGENAVGQWELGLTGNETAQLECWCLEVAGYGDLTTNLVQTGPGSTSDTVTEALAFQAEAYDPRIGSNDGDGIDRLNMRVLNDGGTPVYQHTEFSAIYCAFTDSGGVCESWNFADNNYEWPDDGPLIENGPHTLRVETRPDNGNSKTVNFPIDIQLPIVTNLAQTGPNSTDPIVTEELTFQLEAYVGPRHTDGQDIANVEMEILGSDGGTIYEHTEFSAIYCIFTDSAGPCDGWNFADKDYQWPDGQPIENGPHTLQATVNTTDGRMETVQFPIQIQLPLVTNLIQIGPGHTNTVISDTLVFQVETFVGPNNGDGDDIDSVEMSILNASNVVVHEQTDSQAKYCAFGGGDPTCNEWVFADHDDQWPGGQAAQNGAHTLRAVINTSDGRSETVEYDIEMQLPSAEEQELSVYLPMVLK